MPSPDAKSPGGSPANDAGSQDAGGLGPGAQLRVSVVYALPGEQHIVPLTLPSGASVEQAVHRSGLLQRFPLILERPLQCAIFNRVVEGAVPLREGDRVEILRPLQIDPREARRREAARARSKKR